MKITRFAVVSPVLLLFAACGPLKDLQDTKDTTQKMANTTEEMQQTTEGMSESTDLLYIGQRAGGGFIDRKEALDKMKAEKNMAQKLKFATAYFLSFEYQLYKNAGEDNGAVISELYELAVKEFTEDLVSLMPNPLFGLPLQTRSHSLFYSHLQDVRALSSALHRVNIVQEIVARKTGRKPVTMFDLIQGALQKYPKFVSGEIAYSDLAPHETWIVDKVKIYEFLLQVRASFMGAYVLANLRQEQNHMVLPDFGHELDILLAMHEHWKPEMNKRTNNEASLRYYGLVMDYALQSLSVLRDAGLNPKVDSDISKALAHVDLSGAAKESHVSTHAEAAAETLASKIQQFTQFKTQFKETSSAN
jgi:hypothetical protein